MYGRCFFLALGLSFQESDKVQYSPWDNSFLFSAEEMRIRKPAGLSAIQVLVVSVVGTVGGVYIWRPGFVKRREEVATEAQQQQTQQEQQER